MQVRYERIQMRVYGIQATNSTEQKMICVDTLSQCESENDFIIELIYKITIPCIVFFCLCIFLLFSNCKKNKYIKEINEVKNLPAYQQYLSLQEYAEIQQDFNQIGKHDSVVDHIGRNYTEQSFL